LEIHLLEGASGLRRFVNAPWKILDTAAYPQWIPPLRISTRSNLDPGTNPFFKNAERALFLAQEGGRPLGRIAAIRNGWLADAGQDPGIFGLFECVDRQDAASALFEAAAAWLRERGCRAMLGPWNPSSNYDGGVLIQGFEHPQTFFTPWNPEYYPRLVEGAGCTKAKDLLAWHVDIPRAMRGVNERFGHLAEAIAARSRLDVSAADMRDFEGTMRRCWPVYVECWKDNWGYCPIGLEEWSYLAKELKPLVVSAGGISVQSEGEMVGFMLIMADFNRAIQNDRSGRLLPLNWLRVLRTRTRSPWVRTILAGVLPEFRRKGVLSLMLYAALKGADRYGVQHIEVSWVLEDNVQANSILQAVGAEPYRTWRIYERRF
jgi:GNAT superfamily N-acetyltransferase